MRGMSAVFGIVVVVIRTGLDDRLWDGFQRTIVVMIEMAVLRLRLLLLNIGLRISGGIGGGVLRGVIGGGTVVSNEVGNCCESG